MNVSPEIQHFVDAARGFCNWAEGRPGEPDVEGRVALTNLVRLYGCALDLPDVFGEEEAERIPDADYRHVFKRFGALPFNYYSQQFNPLPVPGEEPCVADLANDMADIWRDLKPGLKQFDAGFVEAAVWEWRHSFHSHWGHHAAAAIFALHCWLTDMSSETAGVLSHIPNSSVVQMPGRQFPGIAMQGDTLSNVFDGVRFLLAEFKARRDEERYFETLLFAEQLQDQLLHYEEILDERGIGLPYAVSIRERLVADDYEITEPGAAPNGNPAT